MNLNSKLIKIPTYLVLITSLNGCSTHFQNKPTIEQTPQKQEVIETKPISLENQMFNTLEKIALEYGEKQKSPYDTCYSLSLEDITGFEEGLHYCKNLSGHKTISIKGINSNTLQDYQFNISKSTKEEPYFTGGNLIMQTGLQAEQARETLLDAYYTMEGFYW